MKANKRLKVVESPDKKNKPASIQNTQTKPPTKELSLLEALRLLADSIEEEVERITKL